jgi:periplasmic divalent cation tolerance protein
MSNKILVLCSVSSESEAKLIAMALVEEKLAACVTIQPRVQSVYRWQGKVEQAEEYLLLIKTRASLWDALRGRVLQLHSYDVPELIAVPVSHGNPAYLRWIDESTSAQ